MKSSYNIIMNLQRLNNKYTDKNTKHSYLPIYQEILSPIKNNAEHILEIGVQHGGSINLWHDYFENAIIYGIDIADQIKIPELKRNNRISLHLDNNGYDEQFIKTEFINKNIEFDFILDDGPHTLDSMKQCLLLYSQLMKEDGILIIEDIQKIEWIDILKNITPDNLKPFIKVYDLRENKNRYDDILFVINKNIEL